MKDNPILTDSTCTTRLLLFYHCLFHFAMIFYYKHTTTTVNH